MAENEENGHLIDSSSYEEPPLIVSFDNVEIIANNVLFRIEDLIPPIWKKEAIKRKDDYLKEVRDLVKKDHMKLFPGLFKDDAV